MRIAELTEDQVCGADMLRRFRQCYGLVPFGVLMALSFTAPLDITGNKVKSESG